MHIGTPRKHSSHSRKSRRESQESMIESASAPWLEGKYGSKISSHGMKATLDRYIANNYTELLRYARFFCSTYNSKINPDVVINNAYLHCIEIEEQTEDIGVVKGWMLNSIKRQVLWQNLDTNKQERITSVDASVPDLMDDDDDLREKIEIERKYHHWKSCVDIYRDSLNDNIKLIVAEAYFEKGYTTARSMAKYFGIPNTSAHYLIKEIKDELKSIYNENQK